MKDYMMALHQRFCKEPDCREIKQQIREVERDLHQSLNRRGQEQLLKLADLENGRLWEKQRKKTAEVQRLHGTGHPHHASQRPGYVLSGVGQWDSERRTGCLAGRTWTWRDGPSSSVSRPQRTSATISSCPAPRPRTPSGRSPFPGRRQICS